MNLETGSLRKRVGIGFLLTVMVVTVLYSSFGWYYVQVYQKYQVSFNQNVVNHYAQSLEKDLSTLENFVKNMASSSPYFEKLTYPQSSEFDWMTQINGISQLMQNKIDSIDFPSALFYGDPVRNDGLMLVFSSQYDSKAQNRKDVYSTLRSKLILQDNGVQYDILNESDKWLLYTYTLRGKSTGFLLNITCYIEEYLSFEQEEQQLVAITPEREILAFSPSKPVEDTLQDELAELPPDGTTRKFSFSQKNVGRYPLQLVLIQQNGLLQSLGKNPGFFIFIGFAIITIAVLFISLYGYLKRIMLMPLEYLYRRVDRIRSGEKNIQLTDPRMKPGKNREFYRIHADLDKIIQEIDFLQKERYQKELEVQGAQLQYLQLQINPHFFLNCLNVIHALHRNGDDASERRFISALVAHFRYVFHDKLSIVALKDELKEVKDYIKIYMIRSGLPVLIKVQVDEDCLDDHLPILAIQTFVENSIKYGSDGHTILSVTIQAFHTISEERQFLCVQVSDNGAGYTQEWLEKNNRFEDGAFDYSSEHVGISNLKYRMSIIYQGKAHMAFYNKREGGAAVDIFFPLEGGT